MLKKKYKLISKKWEVKGGKVSKYSAIYFNDTK